MGTLHFLRAVAPRPSPETACLEAFDLELDYLFWTLQRLGARPFDIEDLLQDVFAVLHNSWSTLDTTRPLRPWLFGVAFCLVRTYRRRQARAIPRDGQDPPDAAPDPDGNLQDRQSLAEERADMTPRGPQLDPELESLLEFRRAARRIPDDVRARVLDRSRAFLSSHDPE